MIPLNRKCFLTDMMCSYMRYALTDIFDCLIPNEDISTGEGLASQRRLKDLAERMNGLWILPGDEQPCGYPAEHP